jgi:hypothetical protein
MVVVVVVVVVMMMVIRRRAVGYPIVAPGPALEPSRAAAPSPVWRGHVGRTQWRTTSSVVHESFLHKPYVQRVSVVLSAARARYKTNLRTPPSFLASSSGYCDF